MNWVYVLGVVLCYTLMCTRIQGYRLFEKDNDVTSNNFEENLVKLLESEGLFLADDEVTTETACTSEETTSCAAQNRKCETTGGTCGGCLPTFKESGTVCIDETACTREEITSCTEQNRKCETTGGTCGGCLPTFKESGTVCIVDTTCTAAEMISCAEQNRKCETTGGGCGECLEYYQESGGECIACDCGDAKCELNTTTGKPKPCQCSGKQQLHKTKCITCDCGDAKCELNTTTGKPKPCQCSGKQQMHKTKCITCDCGDAKCELDTATGKPKSCQCVGKQQMHKTKCITCDCGDAVCEIDTVTGKPKPCQCSNKQKMHKTKCIACDCGDADCKLDATTGKPKPCQCSNKQKMHETKCIACDCGDAACELDAASGKPKPCQCSDKQRLYKTKCVACDCGDADCELDATGKPKPCECSIKQKKYGKKCIACDCGDAECELDATTGQAKPCQCTNKQKIHGTKCIDCDCGEHGNCTLNEGGVKNCECDEEKSVLKDVDGIKRCYATCNTDLDCKHGSNCTREEGGKKICDCDEGLSGDTCAIIDACAVSGKYELCQGEKGTCGYENGGAVCKCTGGKIFDNTYQFCRKTCKKNDCKHGGSCTDSLCECKEGTTGDDCGIVIGCEELDKNTCKGTNAVCIYNEAKTEPTCKCKDNNYEFDGKSCIAKWCKNNFCSLTDNSCEFTDGIGSCNCRDTEKYYDYTARACKSVAGCTYNETCGDNQKCVGGTCSCIPGYTRTSDDAKCTREDVCKEDTCFAGANCTETSIPGIVKCFCDGDASFYNHQRKCDDGSCFLPNKRKNCKQDCPSVMKKDETSGECLVPDDTKKCSTSLACGLGWCMKKDENDTCYCMNKYGKLIDGKCGLNAEEVCASGAVLKNDPMKCNCTGIYSYAKNGITCEKKMCADENIQKECSSKKATCVDSWKDSKGYKCECKKGYDKDSNGVCTDVCQLAKAKVECSRNQQICFAGSSDKDYTCRCPPLFTLIEKRCEPTGKNAFMLKKLPVIIKNYQGTYDSIDQMKLSGDITAAMEVAFPDVQFVQLYNYVSSKEVILCDVWLQFNSESTGDIKRWKSQKYTAGKNILLPPGLLLSEDVKDVTEEKLEFCSKSVRESVCGHGSKCEKDTCSCEDGFTMIDFTIKELDGKTILRCEDVDECKRDTHSCPANTECVNTQGDYYCKCKAGFKKEKGDPNAEDRGSCIDLCSPNPCTHGTCKKENNEVDCSCHPGYGGSLCSRKDENYAKASSNTVVVGAVLGTLLGVIIILILFYIYRQRKNSYSEDFTPAPKLDNAEMTERRPIRGGYSNNAYQ